MREIGRELSQKTFNAMHRMYCKIKRGRCQECDLRLYCYLSPQERTDKLMENVIDFMEEVSMGEKVQEIQGEETACPLKMDFSGAVGYEEIYKIKKARRKK